MTQLLHQLFADLAATYSGHTAVRLVDPADALETSLTYAELRNRSAQFARTLRDRGIRRGDRVGVCLPRGLDVYWTILGILEAGATYVPLDPTYPDDRIHFVMTDSDAKVLITTDQRALPLKMLGINCLTFSRAVGYVAQHETPPLSPHDIGVELDDIAYIIYTSGSTGRPKGVMIRHRNAVAWVLSEAAMLELRSDDKIYQGFSLAFDMSLEEMWSAFSVGATLMAGSDDLAKAGPDIGPALITAGITVWHTVPSLAAIVDPRIPKLRMLNLGGEACPPEVVKRWARPGLRILNTYGPTEVTVTSTWTDVYPDTPITIGRELRDYKLWVVDESMTPVPHGKEGELIIGGPCVGAGYVKRPELTAEKFVITPFSQGETVYRSGDLVRVNTDGDLDFLGRIDTQVKIRGYRVELGEIESVLADDPSVGHAVVTLSKDESGFDALVGYLQPNTDHTIDISACKARVAERLPIYMRPSAYEIIDNLPRLISGKIDRKNLPAPTSWDSPTKTIVAPVGEMETKLIAVWTRNFAPRAVSTDDDFFDDLGGHSLKAARVVSDARMEPALAHISIKDIYEHTTISSLAIALNAKRPIKKSVTEPFQKISQPRYLRCMIAQALSLPIIFGFSGLPWLTPYLLYVYFTANNFTRLESLGLSAIGFITIPMLLIFTAVIIKWLVIGRYKHGSYPLWGSYYFRWWFVRRILSVVPTRYLTGTPMLAFYFRLLGARIGNDCFIGLNDIDAADLVSMGDRTIVSEGSMIANVAVEKGELRIGTAQLGADSFLGVQAVLGRNGCIGAKSRLEDLSMLSTGGRIPDGETWIGSPASFKEKTPVLPSPPAVSAARRFLVTLALIIAVPLLPLASILPIAPGLILMIELDWATEGYTFLLLSPLLGASYVLLMCLQTAAMKWLLLGRVKPGSYALHSFFYVRFWFMRQLGELALELILPIYATLYLRPWYKLMGVRIGERAEISTATAITPDLVEIGAESFVADGVVFGAPRMEPGIVRLENTSIGRRSFIGNSALLPTGSHIGDDVLIGVLSQPPLDGAAERDAGSSWFGSPAINLQQRQKLVQFNEGSTFTPPRHLVATRWLVEYVRVTLSMTVFVALFSLMLSGVSEISDHEHSEIILLPAFPFLYMIFCLAAGLFVVALKWLVIGRYKATVAPLWSMFVWKSELVTSTFENLVAPSLLEPLRGTPFINMYFRLLGAKIGKRVFMDTTDMTEYDLVHIGNDAALNEQCGLQTHLFEDRIMKVSTVTIGERATIGSISIVLYDAVIEADATLGDLSVAMKGENLPAGTTWEGSPAKLV